MIKHFKAMRLSGPPIMVGLILITRAGWVYKAIIDNDFHQFGTQLPWFQGRNGLILSMLLQLLVISAIAFLLQRIVNSSQLFPQDNHLVGLSFIILSAAVPWFQAINKFTLIGLFAALIFYLFFSMQAKDNIRLGIFKISVVSFLGSLLFFPFIVFWIGLLIWIGLNQIEKSKHIMIGGLTVFFLVQIQFLILYIPNKLGFYTDWWSQVKASLFNINDLFSDKPIGNLLLLILVYSIVLTVLVIRQKRNNAQQNTYLLSALITASLAVLAAILFFNLSIGVAILGLFPLSLLLAYALFYLNENLASILILLLVGITIALQIRYF